MVPCVQTQLNVPSHSLFPSLASEGIFLEVTATNQNSHSQPARLFSLLHRPHSRLPNEPKKPSRVLHAEEKTTIQKNRSLCRCIPSDKTWQKLSCTDSCIIADTNVLDVVKKRSFFLRGVNEPAITGQRNLSQSSGLVSFFFSQSA